MSFRELVKALLSLISFLTPFPIPRNYVSNKPTFNHLYLLPIVGLIRGCITVLPPVLATLTSVWDVNLIAFVVIATHFIVQGFLHVDGFIDFSEAILACRFGVNGYKVVKDRYRGSYAIAVFTTYSLGLFSSITALVGRVGITNTSVLLLLAEVWLTNTILTLSYFGREAPEGIGREFKQSLDLRDVILGLLISTIITYALISILNLNYVIFIALAIALILSVSLSNTFASRVLGFVNGDVLGFASELYYLMSLLLLWVITWT